MSESISLDNGLHRGDWGPTDLCPDGSWASSFEIKYADLGYVDDTALNAIRLNCQDNSGLLTATVTSTEGKWGEWRGTKSCKVGQFFVAMRGNVVPDQGTFHDDLGLDNMQLQCSDGVILDGLHDVPSEGDQDLNITQEKVIIDGRPMEAVHFTLTKGKAGDHGDWSSWATCSTGLRICGLETRVEHESTVSDDAGATDVTMFCCTV